MKYRKRSYVITFSILFICINAHAQRLRFDPPWNEPPEAGVNFTINGIDNVPDLYGDIADPQLVIFFAGNQYMVIDDLLSAFKKSYPQYTRVFVETLPPGILAKQIQRGSIVVGNMRIDIKPDVYTAGRQRIDENRHLFSAVIPYAKNTLAIMVRKGNPKNIYSLKDLGRGDVKVSMPNPAWEGVGVQIEKAYKNVGGEALDSMIMTEKVKSGTTILTHIHHRETPLNILYDRSDAGPVWITEALYHAKIHPLDYVTIPEAENIVAGYFAGALKNAPHQQAAADFLKFMQGKEARSVYLKYGFQLPN